VLYDTASTRCLKSWAPPSLKETLIRPKLSMLFVVLQKDFKAVTAFVSSRQSSNLSLIIPWSLAVLMASKIFSSILSFTILTRREIPLLCWALMAMDSWLLRSFSLVKRQNASCLVRISSAWSSSRSQSSSSGCSCCFSPLALPAGAASWASG